MRGAKDPSAKPRYDLRTHVATAAGPALLMVACLDRLGHNGDRPMNSALENDVSGEPPLDLGIILRKLKAEYEPIWADWYRELPSVRPAELFVQLGDHPPRFEPASNQMMFWYSGQDFQEFLRKRPLAPVTRANWFSYKGQLVHEMLHEYQLKSGLPADEIGHLLYGRFAKCFPGEGHSPEWFTALAEKARYFKLKTSELLAEVGVPPKLVKLLFPPAIRESP